MPAYRNGYIPEDLLVTFATGRNSTDGDWKHQLSPSSFRKHTQLVAVALKRTGRVLKVADGWGAYRPYNIQVLAKKIHGDYAASPGTSSHGGFWEGRQTLAVDYSNWAWVYQNHGGQAAFFEDCRSVGLSPGLIMRSRGYPDEPWHVVDLDPWAPVPAATGVVSFDEEEVEDMALPLVITVSHPASPENTQQVYWSVDLAARTKSRIKNGVELDWRRALAIPEYVNQSPAVLDGYIEIGG